MKLKILLEIFQMVGNREALGHQMKLLTFPKFVVGELISYPFVWRLEVRMNLFCLSLQAPNESVGLLFVRRI